MQSPLTRTPRPAPLPEPWGCTELMIWVYAFHQLASGLTLPDFQVLSQCLVPES